MLNDWLCTCGHLAEDHDFDQVAFRSTACLLREDQTEDQGDYIKHTFNYVDDCGEFEPISNLEYLELKTNETNIIDSK